MKVYVGDRLIILKRIFLYRYTANEISKYIANGDVENNDRYPLLEDSKDRTVVLQSGVLSIVYISNDSSRIVLELDSENLYFIYKDFLKDEQLEEMRLKIDMKYRRINNIDKLLEI